MDVSSLGSILLIKGKEKERKSGYLQKVREDGINLNDGKRPVLRLKKRITGNKKDYN